MPSSRPRVHKFGGSSLADASRIQAVADILQQESLGGENPIWVVVSAMGGITDRLISVLQKAKGQDPIYLKELESICEQHRQSARALLDVVEADEFIQKADRDFKDLEDILRSVLLGRDYSEATLELVTGYGELWSAQLLTAVMNRRSLKCDFVDAREILVVEHLFTGTGPKVHWKDSETRLKDWQKNHSAHTLKVATGYIASRPDGVPTTLKRNGSDFSASIFGSLLNAETVTIWTDVDGVLSADPRKVPDAWVLNEMTYNEAMELAFFGAKVLHPHTMGPLVQKRIPLVIRNTFRPQLPGTRILAKELAQSQDKAVKGLSIADNVALINLEGSGMMGVPGIAMRLFASLSQVNVSVILISQASSEHSICFAVPGPQADLAKETVDQAFQVEIQNGLVHAAHMEKDCCILAAVGENMVKQPGVAGTLFSALGRAGVNVRAVAQGSSERNISVVLNQCDADRALQAVHSAFYLAHQTLSLGLIGPGLIGSTLLQQMREQAEVLRQSFGVDIRLRAISSSKKMLLAEKEISLSQWQSKWDSCEEKMDLKKFIAHVCSNSLPHWVLVDCTASEKIAAYYEEWLKRGIHIITPNKKANSSSFESYQKIRQAVSRSHSRYFYEATVGAGLPVISTIRELMQTGDRVLKVEGIFSGTLAYLFNVYDGQVPFSKVVLDAKKKGYTEPDPRDDLSGMDVARKLIILAREMGLALELNEIEVESLVPEKLGKVSSVDEFLKGLERFDKENKVKLELARARNCTLRYVGSVAADGKASVSLREMPMDHPFSRITGSDNIISFTTERYRAQPLTVQGPGAGPHVTAGGVFADILRLIHSLGGKSS